MADEPLWLTLSLVPTLMQDGRGFNAVWTPRGK
jgi:hypothetical protein